jgi:hypothetical protein
MAGCLSVTYPTQQRPTCSWASQPPPNANTLCSTVYRTLTTLVNAELSGDDRAIRRLVTDPQVAGRVVSYGRTVLAQGRASMHAVPSFTLDTATQPGEIGANFSIVGKTQQGQINTQETVYLRIRHGTALLVADQPGEDW